MTSRDGRVALVTGATGFIGRHLVRRLLADGVVVHAIARTQPRLVTKESLVWHIGSLADEQFVASTLLSTQPALVVHLAGSVTGSRDVTALLPTMRGLVGNTVTLLAGLAAHTPDARVLLAGSMEDSLGADSAPSSPYAAGKEAARRYGELCHRLYGTRVTTARIFMVYGPGDTSPTRFVPLVTRSLLRGHSPALSSGERPVDWVYVDDVVDGLLTLASSAAAIGRTLDLGSGATHSVREVGTRLADLVGVGPPLGWGLIPDRPWERVGTAHVRQTTLTCGWQPRVDLAEGLRRTVDWWRRQSCSSPPG